MSNASTEDGFLFDEVAKLLYARLKKEEVDTGVWDPSTPLSRLRWLTLDHPAKHEQGGCTRKPCAALGISYALDVCCDSAREREALTQVVRYFTTGERLVGKQLRECMDELSEVTTGLIEWSDALYEVELKAGGGDHAHRYELMSQQPRQLLEDGRAWIEQLRAFTTKLRQASTDPSLWQPPKPGRRPHVLLKAIRQHLAIDGGLEYGEIARLTPDGGDSDYAKQKDRVRKDIEDIDVRWAFSSSGPGRIVSEVDSAESTERSLIPR